MRSRIIGLAIALLLATGIVACSKVESILGLSHVINDDGSDNGNPVGHNPGSSVITMTLFAQTPMRVGDTLQVVASATALAAVGTFSWANLGMTDSSIASLVGTNLQYVAAHVAGSVQMTGHYESAVATPLAITVLPRDGISAWVDVDSASYGWVPPAFHVAAGSSVQFNVGRTHSVVFDAVPGAPANIAVGATGQDIVRVFPSAGTFQYHCAADGQVGVIIVTP